MKRLLGVSNLTLLDVSPPNFVEAAASAEFDFVGLRVSAASEGEQQFPMWPGSPMLKETQRRLANTGLHVRDIEVLLLGPKSSSTSWARALETGAELGACAVTVVSVDSDVSRLPSTLAELVEDAYQYGIRPTLEPVSYLPISRIEDAERAVRGTGAALLLDALHLARAGEEIDAVRSLEPSLVAALQLSDALAEVSPMPSRAGEERRRARHDVDRQWESRHARLPLGEGELPLRELIAAVAADTPLSLEVPSDELRRQMSPREFLVHHRQALGRLL